MIAFIKKTINRIVKNIQFREQAALPSGRTIKLDDLIVQNEFIYPIVLPNGAKWPKISVITPSYNQGRYIADTIESVILQNYPNVEHIIIDGNSNDETMHVIDRYRSNLTYVISEPDKGQSDALNKGFRRATGEILCWLNSDDQFAPGALAAVAMAFSTRNVDLVTGICEVYKDGDLVHRHMSSCADGPLPLQDLLDLDNGWNAGQFFYQPEVFFTRDLWERSGSHVREDCYYSMDYELWCRFALKGAKLHVIGAPLAHFRMHADQKTADPNKFKKELIDVRKRFAEMFSITVQRSSRPPVQFERVLRVAMVNDMGTQYGAGIAHGRIGDGLKMANHEVKSFELCKLVDEDGKPNEAQLIKDVVQYNPDLVIFGNLHYATRDSVLLIHELSSRFKSFWVTHDFWLFTGRCAYSGECQKYLTGCDETCPTPQQYPDLEPKKISKAWENKQALLGNVNAPYILANSEWSKQRALQSVAQIRSDAISRIESIKLGAPVNLFKPLNKVTSRRALKITSDNFVIAFSVSSLAEIRKGGHYLIEALHNLNLPDVTLLLIGHQDIPLEISGVEVVPLGYITESITLQAALSAADVFVGPSIEETFGQVFIEAAIIGTPSIGFDQTGVRDSIIDGVTGFRVAPSSEVLRATILRLYNDRDLCNSLGIWARLYALNEFSIESAYHSLFATWRKLGLIDHLGVANKIGFNPNSASMDESLRPWYPSYGVSEIEGPYPEFDLPSTFQWCFGTHSRVVLNCSEDGIYLIKLSYYCNLFESIEVKLQLNGESLSHINLVQTKAGLSEYVEFKINGLHGLNTLDLYPDSAREPTSDESRSLTFMIKNIEFQKI